MPHDLDIAARDVAIQSLTDSDAPISQADALLALVTGPALKTLVAARVQLFLAGHTPENDEMLPLQLLPDEARRQAANAVNAIGLTMQDRDLALAEANLAQAAALCMAAIDRLRVAQGRS